MLGDLAAFGQGQLLEKIKLWILSNPPYQQPGEGVPEPTGGFEQRD